MYMHVYTFLEMYVHVYTFWFLSSANSDPIIGYYWVPIIVNNED